MTVGKNVVVVERGLYTLDFVFTSLVPDTRTELNFLRVMGELLHEPLIPILEICG